MAVSASTCISDVWEFYEKSDGKVTCKLCSKELVYRRGTSNLHEHHNRIHKKEYHPFRRIANQRTSRFLFPVPFVLLVLRVGQNELLN